MRGWRVGLAADKNNLGGAMAAETVAWFLFGGLRCAWRLPPWCPHAAPMSWLRGRHLLWRRYQERMRCHG